MITKGFINVIENSFAEDLQVIFQIEENLEVFFQDQVILSSTVDVKYIKSGEEEIKFYVENFSKPDLNDYVENHKKSICQLCETETAKSIEQLSLYNTNNIIPKLDNYVSSIGENIELVNQTLSIIDEKLALTEDFKNSAKSYAAICESISLLYGVKTGSIIATPTTNMPGYLLANGAEISRETYANLFAIIGTIYGVGDGTTTFNLPDLRGTFIRGFLSGTTPGIGGKQAQSVQTHTHGLPGVNSACAGGGRTLYVYGASDAQATANYRTSSSAGMAETRPANQPFYFYIKY